MSFTVTDRTKESSSTTGTGAFTLSGAPSNYVTFNTGVGVNNFTWYAINHLSANEWEVGYAQLTGATTLTRIQVLAGTNGTSFVNFSAGTKEVFVTLPSAFNAQTLGRTNIVINPHGSIQQETTTAQTAATAYYADQWYGTFTASGAAVQYGVTTGAVSSFDPSYMFFKTTTAKGSLAAGDFAALVQPIEGNNVRRLLYGGSSAKGSWLRWRASSSQSGTASVSVRNGAGNRSFVQSFAVTTTPTDYFLFVPGDTTGTWATDNTQGATLAFCHAAGTTFQTSTLGAWQAGQFFAANTQSNMLDTVNRQLNITDVQWSQSAVLLPFEPVDYQQELARCQRYFWARISAGANEHLGVGQAYSTSAGTYVVNLPVQMRTIPTLDINGDITTLGVLTATGTVTVATGVNSTANSSPTVMAINLNVTGTPLVGGNGGILLFPSSGKTFRASARM